MHALSKNRKKLFLSGLGKEIGWKPMAATERRQMTNEWDISLRKSYLVYHLLLLKPETEVEEEAWKGKSPTLPVR